MRAVQKPPLTFYLVHSSVVRGSKERRRSKRRRRRRRRKKKRRRRSRRDGKRERGISLSLLPQLPGPGRFCSKRDLLVADFRWAGSAAPSRPWERKHLSLPGLIQGRKEGRRRSRTNFSMSPLVASSHSLSKPMMRRREEEICHARSIMIAAVCFLVTFVTFLFVFFITNYTNMGQKTNAML